MLIYPAIDILDGHCVRLKQGVFSDSTVYADNPLAMIRLFEAFGATHLHIVDLTGAKNPKERQTDLIARLIADTRLKVQVGGGLRTAEQASELIERGADRVVIGSASVTNPDVVLSLVSKHGAARVTVALDVNVDDKGVPRVALHGWKDKTPVTVAAALKPLAAAGSFRVLCTDIGRDGMLSGPNVELYTSLMKQFPEVEIQASGGVARLSDLVALKAIGTRSVIVGKALYTGAIDLKEAFTIC